MSKGRELNVEQRRAVTTTRGRVLILAGAGSGKTTVLAHRIAHLIHEENVPPRLILGLTFTNKAAQEMRERTARLVGHGCAKQVTLSTFHSFCCNILRKEIHRLGYTPKFTLYDERDVKRLVKRLVHNMLDHEGELPSLESTFSKISFAKNRVLSFDDIEREAPSWHDHFTSEVFTNLNVCMRAYNAVDFDNLLALTLQLFEKHPDVLETYQERFQHIMIDEYQDTNPIQYRLAALLSQKYNNLCVVGDDDQSIYGWRGAEIKNILNFSATSTITLEQNYRSTPTILDAASALIAHNTHRHPKRLRSNKTSGDSIAIFHAPSEIEEAQAIARKIVELRQEKQLAWKDIAILYRSNILSAPLEVALMQAVWENNGVWMRGIPFQVFGGMQMYDRSEIKDLVAYFHVACNPQDQESLLRIVNVPRRGISDQALDKITQINRSQNIPLYDVLNKVTHYVPDLSSKAIQGVHNFLKIIETLKQKCVLLPMKQVALWLLEAIDYQKAIAEEVKSEKMRAFKWENVLGFLDALPDDLVGEEALYEFLHEMGIQGGPEYKKHKEIRDAVQLMTFHSAKGLEFEACFLSGLEDHIVPHEKSLLDTGVEEERRLLYVAITRAKKYLTLSMACTRKKMGKQITCTPSRFLFEIPQHLLHVTSWK